ncbi:MAG: macro domain-containing protein [Planctomycetes bacterium]|nr:macro domain-containing protein [Planctomycetota bacterium]
MATDAIVNPVNNDLILGSDVSGAIRRIGGPQIQEECHAIGTIPLGEAVVTAAGGLPCRWVIHAAVVPLGLWADARWVRRGMQNALARAVERGAKSIAFPPVGHGAGGFAIDRCADIMLDEVLQHFRGDSPVEEAYFILHDAKDFAAFEERMKERLAGVDLTAPARPMRGEAPPLKVEPPGSALPPSPPPPPAQP